MSSVRSEPTVIAGRFRGPPRSANGGYACGTIAAPLAGTVTVRLFAPPPLDTELRLEWTPVESRLYHDDTLLGAGRRASLDLQPPEAPAVAQAEAASKRFVGHVEHSFPTCFVCGPQRAQGDGLRIFPGPLAQGTLVAAAWLPDPALAGQADHVAPVYVWSALDCSGAFAVLPSEPDRTIVLGELTARIDGTVTPGEPHVVVGWALGADGRKRYAGSAVYDSRGRPIAVARATWIEVPLAAFAG